MTPSGFAKLFCVSCVVAALASAALNVFIDPYAYFGSPRIRAVNTAKPTALYHDRFVKAAGIRQRDFDCVFVGSSRIAEGFPTTHAGFESCRGTYDASVAGPNAAETEALLDLADRRHTLRQVLVGADFFMFNAHRNAARGYSAELFGEHASDRILTGSRIAFSLDTLKDSIFTISHQGEPSFYRDDGSAAKELLERWSAARPARAEFLR